MIKYKTVDQIFNSVAEDFRTYDDEDMINYSSLIKVIKTCNAELTLKINPESTAVVEVTDYKGKLPDNFEALNFALLCTTKLVNTTPPRGFHIENQTIDKCKSCSPCLEECEVDYRVIRHCENQWTEYTDLDVVTVVKDTYNKVSAQSMNWRSHSRNEVKIQGDYIHTNFREGTIYLEYTTNLEDEDGNLLVLDNDLVTPYYELECKKHIIKSLYYNSDDDVERKLDRISIDAARAKKTAEAVVNMIEYNELVSVFKGNRDRFYNRFMRGFIGR